MALNRHFPHGLPIGDLQGSHSVGQKPPTSELGLVDEERPEDLPERDRPIGRIRVNSVGIPMSADGPVSLRNSPRKLNIPDGQPSAKIGLALAGRGSPVGVAPTDSSRRSSAAIASRAIRHRGCGHLPAIGISSQIVDAEHLTSGARRSPVILKKRLPRSCNV